ncbi:MAG: hypothetical protein KAV00_12545, partial [Phycisphaerae bacterium]|nr:hypothetical protein [Phycisphaerae bacterium]
TATAKAEAGSETGVGASVALNIVDNNTRAEVENTAALTGAKDITLSATSNHTVSTTAEAGSAGDVSVTPSVAISIVDNDTEALIGTGGTLTLTGNLTATADHTASTTTISDSSAAGADVAVAASIAINIVDDTALVSTARDIAAGGNITFTADSAAATFANAVAGAKGGAADSTEGTDNTEADQQSSKQTDFADEKSGKTTPTESESAETSDGGVGIAAALGLNIADSETRASVAGVGITAGDTLTVRALSDMDASAAADGSAVDPTNLDVGIGVGVAINVADSVTEASIGSGATVTAGGVALSAGISAKRDSVSTFKAEAVSGAGAQDVGVAGSFALNLVDNPSEAFIASGASVALTGGDVDLSATSNSSNTASAKSKAEVEGDVGVGASVALNIADHNITRAE